MAKKAKRTDKRSVQKPAATRNSGGRHKAAPTGSRNKRVAAAGLGGGAELVKSMMAGMPLKKAVGRALLEAVKWLLVGAWAASEA